ncbi:MAG: hypothetical protein ACREXR_17055, partial [Gammaproteobacteria bacterium]
MTTYIKFDQKKEADLSTFGLNFDHLSALFLCDHIKESMPRLLPGMPSEAFHFAEREFKASWLMHRGLHEGAWGCADPETGNFVRVGAVLTGARRGSLPFEMLPVFYGFRSSAGTVFWVCVYSTYGRATQLLLPHLDLVIFEHSQPFAEAVITCLQDTLIKLDSGVDPLFAANKRAASARPIGLLDMVPNFGHQMINHLSGMQRLIDHHVLDRIDQLWLCGVEFFGPLEMIFPEAIGRVRRFTDRWAVCEALRAEPIQLFKIGSTYFPDRLRQRIISRPPPESQSSPKCLVVTVRAEGRRCLNLPDVVAEIYFRLKVEFTDLRVALDGWVFPESELLIGSSVATATSNRYLERIRSELRLAQEVFGRLPSGVVTINTVGRSML